MHPYRTLLFRSPLLEDFMRYTRQRSARVRMLRFAVVAIALLPLVAAWRAKASYKSPVVQMLPMSSTSSTREAPWGLFVSPGAVSTWIGPLPEAAPRADGRSGPFSADRLQAEIATQAGPSIRQCFAGIQSYHPAADVFESSGVIVASVLVRRDGTTDVGVGGDVGLVHAGVAGCVDSAMRSVRFGQPAPDTEWFHFPIRFVSPPPAT